MWFARVQQLGKWALHSSGFPAPSYGGQVKCPANHRSATPLTFSSPPPLYPSDAHDKVLLMVHTLTQGCGSVHMIVPVGD